MIPSIVRLPDCPGNTENWKDRHLSAIINPRRGAESGIVAMTRGLLEYAEAHENAYGEGIGTDYILGPAWLMVARGVLDLLNGDTGRLDCGTMDGLVRDAISGAGFDPEESDG